MTEAELLQAIVDNPDDTELRGVYADFVEQAGDLDRATLIRGQCALAGVPKYHPRWYHQWEWERAHPQARALPALPDGIEWHTYAVDRGFPSRLRVTVSDALLEHAPSLFARFPIQALDFSSHHDHALAYRLKKMLVAPWFRRITRLRFSGSGFDANLVKQLDDAELECVDVLAFEFAGINELGFHALLHTRLLQRVRKLGLQSAFHHPARNLALRPLRDALENTPAFPRLRRLDLRGNRLSTPALELLLAKFSTTVALDLSNNMLDANGWNAVMARSGFGSKQHVDLSHNNARLAPLRELLASPAVRTLRSLRLAKNAMGPAFARALASASWDQLEFLDVSQNKWGDAGVRALMKGRFPKLVSADLFELDLSEDVRVATMSWALGNFAAPP